MISSLPACRGDPGEYWWLPWCVAPGSLCCTARSTQFPLSLFCSTSTRWPCLFSAFPRVVCSGSWAGWAPKYQCKYFGWLELEFVFIGLVLAVGIDGHRRRGFGKGEILDVRHIIKSIHPFIHSDIIGSICPQIPICAEAYPQKGYSIYLSISN